MADGMSRKAAAPVDARPYLHECASPECEVCATPLVGHHDTIIMIPVQLRFVRGKGVIIIPHPDLRLTYDTLPNGQVYFYGADYQLGRFEDLVRYWHCDCLEAVVYQDYPFDMDPEEDDDHPSQRRERDEEFIADTKPVDSGLDPEGWPY